MAKRNNYTKRQAPESKAKYQGYSKAYRKKIKRLACDYPLNYGDDEYYRFIALAATKGFTNAEALRLAVSEFVDRNS